MVTFHHFTAPLWFTRDGGWENPKSVDRFARYLRAGGRGAGRSDPLCLHHQRSQHPDHDDAWCADAMSAGGCGAAEAVRRSGAARAAATAEKLAPYLICDGHATAPNLIAAHRKSYEILKARVNGAGGHHAVAERIAGRARRRALARHGRRIAINGQFLETLKGDDYVGVQTYTRVRVRREAG